MRFSSSGLSVRDALMLMNPACWLPRIHQVNGLMACATSPDSGARQGSSGIASPLSPAATLPAVPAPPHPLPLGGRPVGTGIARLLEWRMSLYQVQQCVFDYLRAIEAAQTGPRPEIQVDGYELTDAERKALTSGDVGA